MTAASPMQEPADPRRPCCPDYRRGVEDGSCHTLPADPPWLTEAFRQAWEAGYGTDDAEEAIRAALPILRAGIREEVARQIIEAGYETYGPRVTIEPAHQGAFMQLTGQMIDGLAKLIRSQS